MIQRFYNFCPKLKKWFFCYSTNEAGLNHFGEKGSLFYELYAFGKLKDVNTLKSKNNLQSKPYAPLLT